MSVEEASYFRPQRLLTQGEVEAELIRLSDALENETVRFAHVAERVAETEADFKRQFFGQVLVSVNNDRRMTVGERNARAHLAAEDAYRISKIYEARLDAARQACMSLRTRIEALRTIAANVRAQS